MTPVSEAVERVREMIEDLQEFEYLTPPRVQAAVDLELILADHARLTEQVRVAREAMLDADRRLSRPDWIVQRDTVRTKLRETLTRTEQPNPPG
jgi:hypothetical protein